MTKLLKFFKSVKRKPKAYKKLMKRKRIYRKVETSIAKRRAAESRLKLYGIVAISISIIFLVSLLYSIISKGYSAFLSSEIKLSVNYDEDLVDDDNFVLIIKKAIRKEFPEVTARRDKRKLSALVNTKASDSAARPRGRRAPRSAGRR